MKPRGNFRQRAGKIFRRLRFVAWAGVGALLLAVAWLSLVGLPDFAKRPLLDKLRERGVRAEFTNLRLSWYRGFVAYNVRFTGDADTAAQQFTAERVEVPFRLFALPHLEPTGLRLTGGQLTLPLDATNGARAVTLEKISASVHFQNDDDWQLENFTARFGQLNLYANGSLAHASQLRAKKISTAPSTNAAARETLTAQLRRVADTLDKIQFTQPADVRLAVSADARDWTRMEVTASAALAGAVTPWGEFTDARVTLRSAPGSNEVFAHVESGFAGGKLGVTTTLNPVTRAATFECASDFDLQKIRPLLREKSGNWISQFSWQRPPSVKLTGSVNLTNALESLQLNGEFAVGPAAFRGVSVDAARSHVSFSNHLWALPDLTLTRSNGVLHAAHWTDDRTQDYFWRLQGQFDFTALAPLLDDKGQHALDLMQFTDAPHLDLEMWGRWRDYDRIGARGSIAITNFTYRGEHMVSLATRLDYTNAFVHLTTPLAIRPEGATTADGVGVDVTTHTVFITNGVGVVNPQALGRAIGRKTAKILEPYQFNPPPRGTANGWFTVDDQHRADITFKVSGTNFHWWKLNAEEISGDVIWRDQTTLVTNLAAKFYTGTLTGGLYFDFTRRDGADYRFDLTTSNAHLGPLLVDMVGKTNQVDGYISGRLNVTNANTEDTMSWNGDGNMTLRDGLLWEIPAFGVFAPVLDLIYPTLGSGRASAGSATFGISNGVVTTDDLQLSSVAMRIQYRGSVDFLGNLNARVEAELLRGAWGIGPVISTVLTPLTKALQYKVTGTLGKPVAEPAYIPKPLMFPLHPIQSVKELFSTKPGETNAAAK
ncbi:MAG: hypothetical protein RLZZ350_1496 [Verrucomicrobiota bacterium]